MPFQPGATGRTHTGAAHSDVARAMYAVAARLTPESYYGWRSRPTRNGARRIPPASANSTTYTTIPMGRRTTIPMKCRRHSCRCDDAGIRITPPRQPMHTCSLRSSLIAGCGVASLGALARTRGRAGRLNSSRLTEVRSAACRYISVLRCAAEQIQRSRLGPVARRCQTFPISR